jgi:hypothetical protein
VATGLSPSADVSDKAYGYLPQRFDGLTVAGQQRPSREPVDFQTVATNVLDYPYDIAYTKLVKNIRTIEAGWLNHVVRADVLNTRQAEKMRESADRAYRLDTLTEDNLPAYVATILGGFLAMAKKHGLSVPAVEEWSRGIWPAEEGGHLLSMNELGKILGITTSPEHVAGRTSQLRSGIEVGLDHVVQLFMYVAWQEQSTHLAHRRNAALYGPVASELLMNIAMDESRHHHVYFKVVEALLKEFPDDVVRTAHSVLLSPEMPGSKGIPMFDINAAKIDRSAIFGVEQAYDAVRMLLKKLGLLDDSKRIAGLSPEGELALQELRAQYKSETIATRPRQVGFILDQTVSIRELAAARRDYSAIMGLAA